MEKSLTMIVLLLMIYFHVGFSAFVTPDSNFFDFSSLNFGTIHFKVKAYRDVYLGLSPDNDKHDRRIVFIIGGWSNRESAVFKNSFFQLKDKHPTEQLLAEKEFREFWVSWKNGHYTAGREGSSAPFLTYDDPENLKIGYYGIGTGWGASGQWEINDQEIFTTDTAEVYALTYFPVPVQMDIKIKTSARATIALSTSPEDSFPIIEICLGHNSYSMIRYNRVVVVRVITPDLLSDSDYKKFMFIWNGGYIEVQYKNKTLMQWTNPNPFKITHIGINTNGGSGSWKSDNIDFERTTKEFKTLDCGLYKLEPLTRGSIHFQLKANKDAYVALAERPAVANPFIGLLFSSWNNKYSAITTGGYIKSQVKVETDGLLSPREFRGFWVSWDSGTYSAGSEGDIEPFMTYSDAKPFPINYFGISTGSGGSGVWRIGGEEIGTSDSTIRYATTFFPISGVLDLEIKSSKNVKIILAGDDRMSDFVIQILIGTRSNKYSSISFQNGTNEAVLVKTPNILSSKEHRRFIIVAQGQQVTVFHKGKILMSAANLKRAKFTHYGVCSTGHGSQWRIPRFGGSSGFPGSYPRQGVPVRIGGGAGDGQGGDAGGGTGDGEEGGAGGSAGDGAGGGIGDGTGGGLGDGTGGGGGGDAGGGTGDGEEGGARGSAGDGAGGGIGDGTGGGGEGDAGDVFSHGAIASVNAGDGKNYDDYGGGINDNDHGGGGGKNDKHRGGGGKNDKHRGGGDGRKNDDDYGGVGRNDDDYGGVGRNDNDYGGDGGKNGNNYGGGGGGKNGNDYGSGGGKKYKDYGGGGGKIGNDYGGGGGKKYKVGSTIVYKVHYYGGGDGKNYKGDGGANTPKTQDNGGANTPKTQDNGGVYNYLTNFFPTRKSEDNPKFIQKIPPRQENSKVRVEQRGVGGGGDGEQTEN